MEKILLALDATCPSRNALEFACYLARLTGSKLTGVFLENQAAEEKAVMKRAYGMSYIDWEVNEDDPAHISKMAGIENNIQWFRQGCTTREVRCTVHRDRNVPITELIMESRFADMIIIDSETNFKKFYEGTPTGFAREILHQAECPVVVAPEDFNVIEEIVFSYDGSSSSIFAMKQFTYLLPQLEHKKATVLQINKTGTWEDRDKRNFTEWLHDHYTSIQFIAQKDDTESGLFNYLFMKKNTILVMGAYGRSQLSRFLRRSPADKIIRTMTHPVFIAHR